MLEIFVIALCRGIKRKISLKIVQDKCSSYLSFICLYKYVFSDNAGKLTKETCQGKRSWFYTLWLRYITVHIIRCASLSVGKSLDVPQAFCLIPTLLMLHSTAHSSPKIVSTREQPESPKIPLYTPIESQKSQHEERHGMPTQPGRSQLPVVVQVKGTFASQKSRASAAKDGDAAMRTSGLEPRPQPWRRGGPN